MGHMGLVALKHVESSQTRDQTHVSCIGRWILNHGTTREVRGRFLSIRCFPAFSELQNHSSKADLGLWFCLFVTAIKSLSFLLPSVLLKHITMGLLPRGGSLKKKIKEKVKTRFQELVQL